MGAIGGDELAQWEKAEGLEVVVGDGKLEKILVSVRLRPLSEKEIARGDPADWECINDTTIIFRSSLQERPMAPTACTFDRVFRSDCATKEVYEEGAKEVALSVVSGINSTIFAYGQTSSGKTYTMTGITEYTVADVYDYISKHEERAFILKFSAMEIYNEVVKDLLSADNIPLKLWDDPEKGTYVENLTEVLLRDWNHLKELISVCEARRKTGETYLNEASSRSHQILRLTIESSAREFLGKGNSTTLVASVNFVDLAGSERASQALSAGARLKEGCHINRSLLTLGTVIRKLSNGRNGHVPYRDSKLTRILQPALGGNARTAIICTMSPARSHIEQSRNTLLFASCAKEVVTNAQVNVVMSDKALVKHLQKELARLESELRYPPSQSSLEALLKEKDAQLRKMDKEIKELKMQRDLAQSRLEDLLKVVGDDRAGMHWDVSRETLTSNVLHAYEDEQSTTESSEVIDHDKKGHKRQFSKSKNQVDVSPRSSITSRPLGGMPSGISRSEFSQNSQDSEDLCKVVRCIEAEETGRSGKLESSAEGSSDLQDTNVSSNVHGNSDPSPSESLRPPSITSVTLEQHLQNVKKPLFGTVKASHEGSNLRLSNQDSLSARGLVLGRSRSCRSTVTSSTLLQELEQDDFTPPSRCFVDFPGRPGGYQRRGSALNYDAESETLSRAESMVSGLNTSKGVLKSNSSVACETDFTGIDEFVAELKEMAQVQFEKHPVGQNGEFGGEGSIRSVGLELTVDPLQTPSRWPLEFEKKQQEIIELWQACNVSLVHRTYFFLLFKGDPADSIYMEVELRRLSFLKNAYSRGNSDINAAVGGPNTSLVACAKKLQREREMLCRQMQKRLTAGERESMYAKWGIALNSKRRRVQLTRLLWTETKDLEHIRESASLVARLIGLLEPGLVLREMFGLSFAPQQSNRRNHNSWRYGIPSLS